jgi:hypothetical protein
METYAAFFLTPSFVIYISKHHYHHAVVNPSAASEMEATSSKTSEEPSVSKNVEITNHMDVDRIRPPLQMSKEIPRMLIYAYIHIHIFTCIHICLYMCKYIHIYVYSYIKPYMINSW